MSETKPEQFLRSEGKWAGDDMRKALYAYSREQSAVERGEAAQGPKSKLKELQDRCILLFAEQRAKVDQLEHELREARLNARLRGEDILAAVFPKQHVKAGQRIGREGMTGETYCHGTLSRGFYEGRDAEGRGPQERLKTAGSIFGEMGLLPAFPVSPVPAETGRAPSARAAEPTDQCFHGFVEVSEEYVCRKCGLRLKKVDEK